MSLMEQIDIICTLILYFQMLREELLVRDHKLTGHGLTTRTLNQFSTLQTMFLDVHSMSVS